MNPPNNFKLLCHKKHLFTRTQYLATFDAQHLLISKVKAIVKLKHSVLLEWDTVIAWQLNKKGQLEAFGIRDIKNQITWFFSTHVDLQNLRKLLSNQVTFAFVTDFYNPLKKVAATKNWKICEVVKHGENARSFAAKFIKKQDLDSISDTLAFSNSQGALLKYFSILTSLEHENFVTTHEIFQGDSKYYAIMDLIVGRTITQLMQDEGSLSLKNVIQIINVSITLRQQALQGLAYLHSKEIIHLNINPDKLFCVHSQGDWPGTLKILGLRNAVRKGQDFIHPGHFGRPGYIAPELLQDAMSLNCAATQKSDVFSLGAIFFKLLTRRELFKGSTIAELLIANKNAQINWAALECDKLPLQIISLIEGMLQVNPEQRLSAADALKHYFKDDSLQFRSQTHFMYQQIVQNKHLTCTFNHDDSDLQHEYFTNELPPTNSIPILTAYPSKQLLEDEFDTELPERSRVPVTIFGAKK